MKVLFPMGLLVAAVFACNLGKPKSTTNTDPLFNTARLADQGASAIDRALGSPSKVEAPYFALDECRNYTLSDGSSVEFHMKNNRPVQIILSLKRDAETPQQALKYAGIDVADTPSTRSSALEEIWSRIEIEGKPLHAGVMKGTSGWNTVRIGQLRN